MADKSNKPIIQNYSNIGVCKLGIGKIGDPDQKVWKPLTYTSPRSAAWNTVCLAQL